MATCNKCGLPLLFEKRPTPNGAKKWFPVNPDGTDHWVLCKETVRAQHGALNGGCRVGQTLDLFAGEPANDPRFRIPRGKRGRKA